MRNISFLYEMDNPLYWQDGLYMALKLLEKDIKIRYWNIADTGVFDFRDDLILVWGSCVSRQSLFASKLKNKKALLLAGGPLNHPDIHKYDLVFVEEEWTQKEMRKMGIDAKLAFGTNTKLFKPMILHKVWDFIYPAAFALWKNHEVFVSHVRGHRALAVGYMQPNGFEKECYEVCLDAGITVLPRVTPDVLAYLINASAEVVVTADTFGGGQRTILEALACKRFINKKLLNPRLLSVYNRGLLTEHDYYKLIKEELWKII